MMRAPDKSGRGGVAWLLPQPSKEHLENYPSHAAGIVTWLVNVPGAHAFWSNWFVSAVSLKEIPGVPQAQADYIGAEFEIMIVTIDPERCPAPDPDKHDDGYPFLTPIDMRYQSHGLSDEQIREIVALMVDQMMIGRISPDSDYRSVWHDVLSQTVTHYREGRHG